MPGTVPSSFGIYSLYKWVQRVRSGVQGSGAPLTSYEIRYVTPMLCPCRTSGVGTEAALEHWPMPLPTA